MTGEGAEAAAGEPKLKAFLTAKDVNSVLFIDDGFEPLQNVEPTLEEQNELWTAITADDAGMAAAAALGLAEPVALDGAQIAAFLERDPEDPLRRAAEAASYVVQHTSKTRQFRFAIEYLQSLGVVVRTAGRETWRDQLDGVSIVFLDWRLGPESDRASAIAEASRTAAEIHRDPKPNRPMIVLISSDPAVKAEARPFSERSGLIPGLFDAMPKEWLKDQGGVDLQLTVLGEHLQKGHVVQGFVDAVNSRATEAIRTFVDTIRNLTLSDYANLQHFALKHEGHPLGDYLTELLAGVWVDALFQGALREQLGALDKEDFESLPALAPPSDALNDLYNAAVFDTHVGDFTRHPQASEPGEGDPERLSIALGDVIVESDDAVPTRAYMILNPQCDLAESPRHKRRIDDDLSVLLVPGKFRPVGPPERTERKESADTPFFAADGVKNRIQWEGKKQLAIPYAGLDAWLKERPRRRRARMRPMFALALQTAIRSDLTRVGLPVAPPMYEPVEISLRKARLGAWNGEPATIEQGRLLMARDAKADQIVLTHALVTQICDLVAEGVDALDQANKGKDRENATKIRDALADPAELKRFVLPFSLADANASFLGGAVIVCRASKVPTQGFDRKIMVCLSLADPETVH